jgi:methionyl-tRNA formyltransferase
VRIALISQIPQAVAGITPGLRELGHEPVGLLCTRMAEFAALAAATPTDIDMVVPAERSRVAPLLRTLEPDLALCFGFPWKIGPEALTVPPLGIVNLHPSLLPRFRGPNPVAAAIRAGETESGITLHRMAEELDTGPILAQAPFSLEDLWTEEDLGDRIRAALREALPVALERAERGDEGEPQREDDANYVTYFEPEYAWIDWAQPAAEIERQVRAWRFAGGSGERGALTELDGEQVRVLRVSLEPAEGREVACGDGPLWVVESEQA